MNYLILITILILILLYAASHVIPIGNIVMFAVAMGFFLSLDVYMRRKKQKKERQTDEKEQ